MIHNVEQVLLEAFFGAIIVAHGPVEMSFRRFCCKHNKAIFSFSRTLFAKNALRMWKTSFNSYMLIGETFHIPLSERSVNHFTPSSRCGPLQIFFISFATPLLPIVKIKQYTKKFLQCS